MGGKIAIHGTYETILNDPLSPKNMSVVSSLTTTTTTDISNDRNNNEQKSKQQHRTDVVVDNNNTHVPEHKANCISNGESTDGSCAGNNEKVSTRMEEVFMPEIPR